MNVGAQGRTHFVWLNCVARIGVPVGVVSSAVQIVRRGYHGPDLFGAEVIGLVLVTMLSAVLIAYLIGAYLWSRQKHMRNYFEL